MASMNYYDSGISNSTNALWWESGLNVCTAHVPMRLFKVNISHDLFTKWKKDAMLEYLISLACKLFRYSKFLLFIYKIKWNHNLP